MNITTRGTAVFQAQLEEVMEVMLWTGIGQIAQSWTAGIPVLLNTE